ATSRHSRRTASIASIVMLWLLSHAGPLQAGPKTFEVGASNKDALPGGKEADGILADFVIRNKLIEAVISGDSPGRKANMVTNWASITPGCL
ncbi:MAG: hypothetical protein QGH33_00890, partial [Pirellulaceae bacterium]|nr:hypothetical protein [Pirellulaceae bacterium]